MFPDENSRTKEPLRIVVAMSGGVDSSVVAAMLAEQGHEVIGITLNVWQKGMVDTRLHACCSLSATHDAQRVADRIGIPHYSLNFREIFAKEVMARFVASYASGRTPNPCVDCNQFVKFAAFLKRAQELDADYLATGHYARIERDAVSRRYRLHRALDPQKDQSYVLYMLGQQQLARTLFPMGTQTKTETRDLARRYGLHVADKPDSYEICFVTNDNYRDFLESWQPGIARSGPICFKDGKVLGAHDGTVNYTVGQRRGLGLTWPRPLYVIALDPEANTVFVGEEEDLYAHALQAIDVHWVAGSPPTEPIRVNVRTRYRMEEVEAIVEPAGNGAAEVVFARPIRAVAPGQATVFYQDDEVIGGGRIDRVLNPAQEELLAVV
ncbi:MAG: tRNA 2-thiouridine(34) synthase MnmA [Chloroflexi bacterium]|nr:tRNA 2-thiouridine(34) synthase MnmA [Chloroflexota bacterium]